jgi:hypothetical protein
LILSKKSAKLLGLPSYRSGSIRNYRAAKTIGRGSSDEFIGNTSIHPWLTMQFGSLWLSTYLLCSEIGITMSQMGTDTYLKMIADGVTNDTTSITEVNGRDNWVVSLWRNFYKESIPVLYIDRGTRNREGLSSSTCSGVAQAESTELCTISL